MPSQSSRDLNGKLYKFQVLQTIIEFSRYLYRVRKLLTDADVPFLTANLRLMLTAG